MKGHFRPSRKLCDLIEALTNSSDITRGAQWFADRKRVPVEKTFSPVLPILKARFNLTDADAAEATLLAGNFSICRRAFR